MKDRIEKIMTDYSLSASQFADKIGVPRSGLSHILKGRNKPSLDYVLKIIDSFPEIETNWLLKGDGNYSSSTKLDSSDTEDLTLSNITSISNINKKISANKGRIMREIMPKEIKNTSYQLNEEESAPYGKKQALSKTKEIEKIVFFYTDGSFKEYS